MTEKKKKPSKSKTGNGRRVVIIGGIRTPFVKSFGDLVKLGVAQVERDGALVGIDEELAVVGKREARRAGRKPPITQKPIEKSRPPTTIHHWKSK